MGWTWVSMFAEMYSVGKEREEIMGQPGLPGL